MSVDLDHLIVFCSAGAPEAEDLVGLGLTEGSPNIHTGQGRFATCPTIDAQVVELMKQPSNNTRQNEPLTRAMTTRNASCSCGQLTFVTDEEPIRVSVCHCHACQRRTGSPFGVQARFRKAGVTIAGVSSEYVRVGDRGSKITFHFCPFCGSTVHYQIEGRDDSVVVPVGAFAEPTFPSPTISVYEERKHSWVQLPEQIEHVD